MFIVTRTLFAKVSNCETVKVYFTTVIEGIYISLETACKSIEDHCGLVFVGDDYVGKHFEDLVLEGDTAILRKRATRYNDPELFEDIPVEINTVEYAVFDTDYCKLPLRISNGICTLSVD